MSTIIIDQNNKTANDVTYLSPYSNTEIAAGFTGNGGKITQVKIKEPYFDNTGIAVRVSIHTYNGTWPNGTPGTQIAQSETVDAYDLSADGEGFVTFIFTGNNQLQTVSGSRYFIVFGEVNSASTNISIPCNQGSNIGSNGGNTLLGQNSWNNYDDVSLVFQVLGPLSGFTVVYDGNGSTGGSAPTDNNSPYNSGALVTVLGNTGSLTKTGHRFLGWNTTSSATTAQYTAGSTFNIYANTTLYAIWKQIFTVTYNGNGNTGGSVPPDNSSPYDTGSTVTVLGNTGNLTKTNCTFKGWNSNQTNANNGIVQYTQGSTFTIDSNTVLYAVWQTNSATTYTVTYDANRPAGTSGTGSVPNNSNQYAQGTSVPVTYNSGNLITANYTFKGWDRNSTAVTPEFAVSGTSVSPSSFSMGASNVTLFAVWGSNSGGGGFDGGTINNPLEIKCKFPSLLEVWSDVSSWMNNAPVNPSTYDAYLRFTNKNPSPVLSTDIYGIAFNDGNTDVAGIGINDSLLVRKNLYAKKAGIGTIEVPTLLQVDSVKSFTENTIKLDGQIFLKTTLNHTLAPATIVRKIWGFKNGWWAPDGFDESDYNKSWITLNNETSDISESGINLFMVRTDGTDYSPLLVVDRGMVVKKDFTAGGFLAANQGALYLGSGLHTQIDIPKIILRNAWIPKLGDSENGEITGARPIPKGTQPPTEPEHYQLYIRTDAWNGNPPNTLYKWNDDNKQSPFWESLGPTSAFADTFDTLYIRKLIEVNGKLNDNTPGNLDAGDVSVHGQLDCLDLRVRGSLTVDGSGSVGSGGVQGGRGNTRPEVIGGVTRYRQKITFKNAYTSQPAVTVTILDNFSPPQNPIPTVVKIVELTNTYFTVETWDVFTQEHKHKIGSAGSASTGSSVPNSRALGLTDVNGNNYTVGSVIVNAGSHPLTDLYTSIWSPGASDGFKPKAAYFTWIAVPETQNNAV